jgi:adenylate cyclase class 2
MPLESELKVVAADFSVLRKRLQDAGADFQGRVLETNAVFDDADGGLAERGELLRLRSDDRARLTFKRPSHEEKPPRDVKRMEETEVFVDDFDTALSILQMLGFRVAFWYEKIREKWTVGGVEVCLDELPFGRFVEIEGGEQDIRRTVENLGLQDLPTSRESYHRLHELDRLDKGLPPEPGFVFSPEQKRRLLDAT